MEPVRNAKKEKKKFKWLTAVLLILITSSVIYFVLKEDIQLKIEGYQTASRFDSKTAFSGVSIKEGTYSYSFGRLTFSAGSNGVITMKQFNKVVSRRCFVISGEVNGAERLYSCEDFEWTWSKSNYTYLKSNFNYTINESYNESYRVDVFTGYNNFPNFPIYQTWEFNPLFGTAKDSYNLTNNLGININNTKFWFVNQVTEKDKITFDGIEYNLTSLDVHLKGNFNDKLPRLDFKGYEFRYQKLLDDGFDITDLIIGDAGLIGHPDKDIVALGISRGNGVFPNTKSVFIDPEQTGFKSPVGYGSPLNQWTSGNLVAASDDLRTTETSVGDKLDTQYDLGVPTGATDILIQVKVEGNAGAC